MKALKILILAVLVGAVASVASASFMVNVVTDVTLPPTDPGLVAYNIFVVSSDANKMAAFNADFTGAEIRQVWRFSGYLPTPYNQDLATFGGECRNDSHLGYLVEELLAPGGGATELNDLSLGSGKGKGPLWCPADLGVINTFQSTNAFLARIVLPTGASATLDLKVYNGLGVLSVLPETLIPEPATLALLALGGVVMAIRRRRR